MGNSVATAKLGEAPCELTERKKMSRHITGDQAGPFDYQCQNCGEWKPDTEFEPSGASEVCLGCEEEL